MSKNRTDHKLIVVMDAGHCSIFDSVGSKIVSKLEQMELEETISPHLENERSQNYNTHSSHHGHYFMPHSSPKDLNRHDFAKEIYKTVYHMIRNNTEIRELIIVAEPKMLHHFRDCLDKKLNKMLTKTVNKDLTHASIAEIEAAVF